MEVGRGRESETLLQDSLDEPPVAALGRGQKDWGGWPQTKQEQIWEGKDGEPKEVQGREGGYCTAFLEHSAGVDPCKETDPLREEGTVETGQQVEELVARILEAESHTAWSPREEGRFPFSPLFSNFLQFSPKFLQLLRLLSLEGLQAVGQSSPWGQRPGPGDSVRRFSSTQSPQCET